MLSDKRQRELMRQAQSGSPSERKQAIAELLEDFREPSLAAIYKVLLSCALGSEHAEEALHVAIVKFLTAGLKQYKGTAAPRTYFNRIAINAALDVARRIYREVEIDEDQSPPDSPGGGAPIHGQEERLIDVEIREALIECVELLPERYHRAIRLYYLEEAGDCETCAAEVGVNKLTFMKHLSRGRLALVDCLRRKLG